MSLTCFRRHLGQTLAARSLLLSAVSSRSFASKESSADSTARDKDEALKEGIKKVKKKKTMAELDEELRIKMEGTAGDGGDAGLELEDGKAVAMKRGVRENMFRYI